WLAAHHDAERAVAGGLRGARDRRVGEGGTARCEGLAELARERDRTGAHVDYRLARMHEGGEPAATEADRAHVALPREAQEHDLGAFRYLGYRGRGLHSVGGEGRERRWTLIEGQHRGSRLPRQVSTHRLAHAPEPDESKHACRCHAC